MTPTPEQDAKRLDEFEEYATYRESFPTAMVVEIMKIARRAMGWMGE